MSWLKVDDQIGSHPKTLAAGAEASWLWLCAIAYSRRHLTDGFVPFAALPTLGRFRTPVTRLAEKLLAVRLFDSADGGYRVHDYHDHNDNKGEVLAARQAAAERKAKSRSRRRDTPVTGQSQCDTPEAPTTQGTTTATTTDLDQKEHARGRARMETTPDPLPILTALVAREVQAQPRLTGGDLMDHLKTVAARAHLPYDGRILSHALDLVARKTRRAS